MKDDFRDLIAADQVEVFDILAVPELTPYELTHKLIFIVKKEDDNLRRLLSLFLDHYPSLRSKSVLIIDDEADLASVSFRKTGGLSIAGVISQQIDQLRQSVTKSAFLQVTATPYALYLQPEDELVIPGGSLFKPKRPAFTVLLPTHSKYVGGDEYFEKSTDPDSPAFYFHREVPLAERDALKKQDRRRLQIDRVLTERNAAVLTAAIVTFLVGGAIRRLQQRAVGQRPQKYSFLFHTEQSRSSHEWQERVASAIRDALVDQARADSPLFHQLVRAAYVDLRRSIELEGVSLPILEDVVKAVLDARIESLIGSSQDPILVDVAIGVELLNLAYANLEFDDTTDDDREAHIAALEHLSRTCKKSELKGKVWLLVAKDRNVARYREEGRFSNAPDTKQQKDLARTKSEDIPVLMLLRQNGDEAKGRRGLPFWWPVIMTPQSAVTAIFAMEEAVPPSAPTSTGPIRSLSTEEVA